MRFLRLGEVVAAADISPAHFAVALDGRVALVLAPSSARGWFGGRGVVAWEPAEVVGGSDIAAAGISLETAFNSPEPAVVAALVTYEGDATIVRFGGAIVLDEDGWRSWGEAPADLPHVVEQAARAREPRAPIDAAEPLLEQSRWGVTGREYRAGVEEVRARIAAGDVYVLNLTTRLTGTPRFSPAQSFSALVERAGSEMNAFLGGLSGERGWIASVSPERFLRVSEEYGARVAEVCPIKGTRPRGTCAEADSVIADALRADIKERAEHVMVVDMERNDLGRVCMTGTVRVDPLYEVVSTPYCHQLVSTVHGTLAEKASFAELLEATFPCGSVTGAPKVAAIRIAAEIERAPRGAYCGALLVAVPAHLDSSVLIRTLEQEGTAAAWGTGCGVTYDSDAVSEHLEMLLKAAPVIGDGVPAVALRETMRVVFGRIPLLERHLSRLAQGGCGPSLLARVSEGVAHALSEIEPSRAARARIGVTVTPDAEVAVGASLEPSSLDVEGGPRIAVVRVASAPDLPRSAAKPASRRYWDRAHNEARMAGADQAVLVGDDDTLIDGSTATIWLVRDGRLLTPPAPPAVAGVARELVFDLALALGIPAEERSLTVEDLEAADEVFLSNALGGVVPARGRGGEIAQRVADAVAEVFSAGRS